MLAIAVSGRSPSALARLAGAATSIPPDLMPCHGRPTVEPTGHPLTVVVHWQQQGAPALRGPFRHEAVGVSAATDSTRSDPLVTGVCADGAVVSNRAAWAAHSVTGALRVNPRFLARFVNMDFGAGSVAPWLGVEFVAPDRMVRLASGQLLLHRREALRPGVETAEGIAERLVAAAARTCVTDEVELSLTGGKDSRLIAAALAAAGISFTAQTHGSPEAADVLVAADVAAALGVKHRVVTSGSRRTSGRRVHEVDVLARLRAAVLLSDGGLSAFENLGGPDPARASTLTVGGQGGELLRGGYAKTVHGHRALAAVEVWRRLALRRSELLRPAAAARYLAHLTPEATRLARAPLKRLDDFYAANRAGRWSASSRQVLRLRGPLAQPFFDADIHGLASAHPMGDRVSERLAYDVLHALHPTLARLPLADDVWGFQKQAGREPTRGRRRAAFDWRRNYGPDVQSHLREVVLDLGAVGPLYDVLDRRRVALALAPEADEPVRTWTLATLAVLASGDWARAREPGEVFRITEPGE